MSRAARRRRGGTQRSRGRHPLSRRSGPEPLPPKRKWRAILLATLVLVPAYWSVLIAVVSAGSDAADAPNPVPAFALGLSLFPFAFLVLAFLSEHPRGAPGAVLRAMGLALLVGIPLSAVAGDAITGMVAAASAGGAVALRFDEATSARSRTIAVVAVTAYVFVMLRMVGDVAVLLAPVLPFTALGVADHLAERRWEREGG